MALGQTTLFLTANNETRSVTLEENAATETLKKLLSDGDIVISMSDYGGFEKVGKLPQALPADNTQITTQPGDIMLYQGNSMVIFYGSNTWSYTPLGKIDGADAENVRKFLGEGSVSVRLSLSHNVGMQAVTIDSGQAQTVYDLQGNPVNADPLPPGVYIINGTKVKIP